MFKKLKNTHFSQIFLFIKVLSLFFVAFLTIFSALVYYFYSLNLLGVILSIILSIISIIILKKYIILEPGQITKDHFSFKHLIKLSPVLVYLILILATFLELWQARTSQAIISPWELVSESFFIFYFLASLLLFLIIYQNKHSSITISLISLHYFLGCIVALIIYKLGYGFDPFVHQATLEVISKQGVITPKTPYYLGQYGLIISLHKILGISITFLNKWLLAVLAAWLLPQAIFSTFYKIIKKLNNNHNYHQIKSAFFATTILLTLSLPLFIVSTPQNLSYLFLILTILYGFNKNIIPSVIFALTTLAIHPLAGLPAIIWIFWLLSNKLIENYKEKFKKYFQISIAFITFIISATFIPLALFQLSNLDFITIRNSALALFNNFSLKIYLQTAGQESWWLNLNYFLYFNRFIILFLVIFVGFIIFIKFWRQANYNLSQNFKNSWLGLIIISSALLISSVFSSIITFQEIIAYEQGDYANRIFIISIIFLSPFIFLALARLINLILVNKKSIQFIWLIIFLILLTNILYLTYPRFDKYYNARGYNTSYLDIETVKLIDEKSKDPYLVLANQQVSVAALKTFGFNNYFSSPLGPIYFYPIPTGGPLYKYYLDMVYKNPSQETMTEAMNLVGVKQAYLVINKYWHASNSIIEAAKISSQEWQELNQGDIFIFYYKINN